MTWTFYKNFKVFKWSIIHIMIRFTLAFTSYSKFIILLPVHCALPKLNMFLVVCFTSFAGLQGCLTCRAFGGVATSEFLSADWYRVLWQCTRACIVSTWSCTCMCYDHVFGSLSCVHSDSSAFIMSHRARFWWNRGAALRSSPAERTFSCSL